jgi:hypothetical protein
MGRETQCESSFRLLSRKARRAPVEANFKSSTTLAEYLGHSGLFLFLRFSYHAADGVAGD